MLGSSILVSLTTVLVSAISFLSQIVLAWRFGATSGMDVYLVGISMPMFVSGIFTAALSYSLVPALVNYQPGTDAFRKFAGALFTGFFTAGICISIVGSALSPLQIKLLGESFSETQRFEALAVARISWLTSGLMLFAGYLRGLHNVKQQFFLSTSSGLMPPLFIIYAGLTFSESYGLIGIAWAMLVGVVLSILLLLIHTYKDINLETINPIKNNEARQYFSHMPLIILSMLCFTTFQLVDSYWAPQIGTGNLSYLAYCQRLVVSIGNLVIAGPSLVVFPRLSKAHVDGYKDQLLIDTIRLLRIVLACSLPIAISIGILAEPFVILLFERGAFVRQDALNVATLLPWMLLGMVPMLCVVMIFRVLFAQQDVVSAFALGALTTALYFILSGLLIRQFGVIGIAIAYAGTWSIVFFIAIFRLCGSDLKQFAQLENMLFARRIGLLMIFTGTVAVLGNYWLIYDNLSSSNLGIRLVVVGAMCFLTYCTLATRVIVLEEIRSILNYVYRKTVAILVSKKYKS